MLSYEQYAYAIFQKKICHIFAFSWFFQIYGSNARAGEHCKNRKLVSRRTVSYPCWWRMAKPNLKNRSFMSEAKKNNNKHVDSANISGSFLRQNKKWTAWIGQPWVGQPVSGLGSPSMYVHMHVFINKNIHARDLKYVYEYWLKTISEHTQVFRGFSVSALIKVLVAKQTLYLATSAGREKHNRIDAHKQVQNKYNMMLCDVQFFKLTLNAGNFLMQGCVSASRRWRRLQSRIQRLGPSRCQKSSLDF